MGTIENCSMLDIGISREMMEGELIKLTNGVSKERKGFDPDGRKMTKQGWSQGEGDRVN